MGRRVFISWLLFGSGMLGKIHWIDSRVIYGAKGTLYRNPDGFTIYTNDGKIRYFCNAKFPTNIASIPEE